MPLSQTLAGIRRRARGVNPHLATKQVLTSSSACSIVRVLNFAPMKKIKLVLGALAVILVILVVAGIAFVLVAAGRQQVSADEPSEIVHDFYGSWLAAARSTTTDPYQAGLAEWPLLGKELRAKIGDARDAGSVDPVLCQTFMPEEIAQRAVSETDSRVEYLVTARRSTSTEQATVTLLSLDGGWYIDDIQCSPGEFAPEREFSFDGEGNILKGVPAPLNSEQWHLIFEQGGQTGLYVPLFFGPESTCLAADGSTGVCSPDAFVENAKARVQGEMTERGVDVKRLELGR